MATFFNLTLDTLGPQGVAAVIDSGSAYATSRDVTLGVTTTDGDTSGYQVKIWGDVDTAANASIQATEAASGWVSYAAATAVRLSTGDGVKTLNVRVRDDVWNESGIASDTITLDTTAPVPNVTVGPDVSRISKVAGKRTATFSWSADAPFEEYKVKVVTSSADAHTAGTVVPTTNGSTNMTGAAGGYAAGTNITSSIDGRDLEAASPGDGTKVIKVFVRDVAGNWSV